MKELKITLIFVALALLAAGTSWFFNRTVQPAAHSGAGVVGAPLFPDFTDVNNAASLEIIKYNSETSEKSAFQVKQVNNRWSIPSHENYPTDAQSQLIEAAGSVIGLEILNLASADSGDQEMYGVIDPDTKDLPSGSRGVGTKVVLKNARGDTLVGLIIGLPVKEQKNQRYVRRIGQNPVYTTNISTDKLSTNFGDWIEKDLLLIDAWDIKRVTINDLSLKMDAEGPALVDGGCMKFSFDDQSDPSWKLDEILISQKNGKKKPIQIKDTETVNYAALGRLAQALDDLKIVDVCRKSEAFSQSLKKTGNWEVDTNTQMDLLSRGFCLLPLPTGPMGTEQITLVSSDGEITVDMGQGVEYVLRFGSLAQNSRAGQNASQANRYLFVMVQFNKNGVEKPVLETVPDEPNPQSPDAAKIAEIQQKIADVKAENAEKEAQYQKRIKASKDKVERLNKRFADWYYVIDDTEYKKIHLTKKDVIILKSEAHCDCGEEDCEHDHAAQQENNPVAPISEAPQAAPEEINPQEYESPELDDSALSAPAPSEEEKNPVLDNISLDEIVAEPIEEVKPEEVKLEEVKPEEVKPEEVKPEEVKPEEVKPEEVKPEEVTPEEVKPEEVKPEEVKQK